MGGAVEHPAGRTANGGVRDPDTQGAQEATERGVLLQGHRAPLEAPGEARNEREHVPDGRHQWLDGGVLRKESGQPRRGTKRRENGGGEGGQTNKYEVRTK